MGPMRFPKLSRALYCAALLSAGGLQAAAAQPDPSTDPRFAEAAERARLEGDKVFKRILINGQLPRRAAPAATESASTAATAPAAAAKRAASEQELPGSGETIEYEDEKGIWHVEFDPGTDRPATEVADD